MPHSVFRRMAAEGARVPQAVDLVLHGRGELANDAAMPMERVVSLAEDAGPGDARARRAAHPGLGARRVVCTGRGAVHSP